MIPYMGSKAKLAPTIIQYILMHNGWVYEQVCLAEYSNLPINLMANLLIYRVSSRFLFIN